MPSFIIIGHGWQIFRSNGLFVLPFREHPKKAHFLLVIGDYQIIEGDYQTTPIKILYFQYSLKVLPRSFLSNYRSFFSSPINHSLYTESTAAVRWPDFLLLALAVSWYEKASQHKPWKTLSYVYHCHVRILFHGPILLCFVAIFIVRWITLKLPQIVSKLTWMLFATIQL